MTLQVKTHNFEGTLDLLLEKVKKKEINPLDLDLSQLTVQIREQCGDDLVLLSDTLVALSTLVVRKSKALLPLDDEEPEAENLEQSVEDFESYHQLTLFLDQLEERDEPSFTRKVRDRLENEISVQDYLEGVEFDELSRALHDVLAKFSKSKVPLQFDEQLEREMFTVEQKIVELRDLLKKSRRTLSFDQFFSEARSKLEIIVTFLAMLELIKQQEIQVRQDRKFGPIGILRK